MVPAFECLVIPQLALEVGGLFAIRFCFLARDACSSDQQVDVLFALGQLLVEILKIVFFGDIAGAKTADNQMLECGAGGGIGTYGIIWPPPFGSCDLAAASRASLPKLLLA